MHILDEKFRKKLIDIYEGKITTVFRRPEDIFNKVLIYLAGDYDTANKIYEVRELIDALADWTHNPTESGLRKILDVEETVSGYVATCSADGAIAAIAYCITHGIPGDVDIDDIGGTPLYKISFENITISQRDAIMKASTLK